MHKLKKTLTTNEIRKFFFIRLFSLNMYVIKYNSNLEKLIPKEYNKMQEW